MKRFLPKSSFFVSLCSDSWHFQSSWWQNPKRALVLNQSDIINKWKKLALRNRNLRKKKECILLFIITSWMEQMANKNLRDRMQILVSHGFLKEADFVSWKRTWEEGHFYRTTHYRSVLNNENSSKHTEVNFRKIYRKTSVLE